MRNEEIFNKVLKDLFQDPKKMEDMIKEFEETLPQKILADQIISSEKNFLVNCSDLVFFHLITTQTKIFRDSHEDVDILNMFMAIFEVLGLLDEMDKRLDAIDKGLDK